MAKASSRLTPTPIPSHPPVLRIVNRLPPPVPQCQDVADGLNTFRAAALCGEYVGVLVAGVHADGSVSWNAYGTLSAKDNTTATVSSTLCAGVYRDCWTGD